MKRLSILLLVAACGGKAAPSAPDNSTPTAGGAPYDALFEQGRTWTLSLTRKTTPPPDMGEPSQSDAGAVTCTVAMAHAMGEQRMAQITCGETDGELYTPAGWWIADPRGLWHFDSAKSMDDIHAELGALDEKRKLMPATPGPYHNEISDEEEGGLEVYGAKAGADGSWCVYTTFAMGDEAGFELCLAAGKGIVSGTSFSAGATVYETTFTAK